LKNTPTDWAIGHKATLQFKFSLSNKNLAGLVLNYLPAESALIGARYLVAAVDADTGTFKLLRYNGSAFVTEYAAAFSDFGFSFVKGSWYSISALPTINTGATAVSVTCKLRNEVQEMEFTTSVAHYGAISGSFGLFADRTYAYFNKLEIE